MKKQTQFIALVLGFGLVATASLAAQRYLRSEPVAGQPVVQDSVTDLMWQGCAMGQTGAACVGEASNLAWGGALAYCQQITWGGYDDWRLPSIRELLSITEDRWHVPAIDLRAFPATPSEFFWTSSTVAWDVSRAWSVYFSNGGGYSHDKTSISHVRCVRLGP